MGLKRRNDLSDCVQDIHFKVPMGEHTLDSGPSVLQRCVYIDLLRHFHKRKLGLFFILLKYHKLWSLWVGFLDKTLLQMKVITQ